MASKATRVTMVVITTIMTILTAMIVVPAMSHGHVSMFAFVPVVSAVVATWLTVDMFRDAHRRKREDALNWAWRGGEIYGRRSVPAHHWADRYTGARWSKTVH